MRLTYTRIPMESLVMNIHADYFSANVQKIYKEFS